MDHCLRLPLIERVAYYLCTPITNITLYLWGHWNVPIAANPLGWKAVAYQYWVEDTLIPGVAGSAWRARQDIRLVRAPVAPLLSILTPSRRCR